MGKTIKGAEPVVTPGMKLTVRQEDLAAGLATVGKAVTARTTLPILANVLIEAIGSELVLSGTNLEIGVTRRVTADVAIEGRVTVPARLLGEFVASLPAEPIEIELDTTKVELSLACGAHRAQIKGISADDFPILPMVGEGGVCFSIPAERLSEIIGQVSIAVASDESRPVLAGVLTMLDPDAGRMTMAAADGFRLAIHDADAGIGGPEGGKVTVVVPGRAMAELGRAAAEHDGAVLAYVTEARNQIMFRLGKIDICSQLIDNTFPDYERIVPRSHSARAILNTKALRAAVKTAGIFAKGASNVVRLGFKAGSDLEPAILTISGKAAESGSNQSELEMSMTGESIVIAFNAKYLSDALAVVGTDQTVIELQTPQAPGVVLPMGDSGFKYVVMPMNVAEAAA